MKETILIIILMFIFSILIQILKNKSKKNKPYKNQPKKKLTNTEKKEKGNIYEKYVSNYYKNLGYITWEHGLEKGYNDQGIDIFATKENKYLFIQCKNWESWKITDKKIIKYRNKAKKYMINNPRISRHLIDNNYKLKLLMIAPKDCFTKKAKEYIKENNDIVDYKIIPF